MLRGAVMAGYSQYTEPGSEPEQDSEQERQLSLAVDFLKQGLLVAFPTETVYGLGADAASEEALARLYAVKGRPTSHPVIVHLSRMEELEQWSRGPLELAFRLAEQFWPGPMTLILPRAANVSLSLTGGQDSVGLRIPSHPLALALLSRSGPLAAPSANKFGKLSPTTAEAVRQGLGTEVAAVLDGGPCQVGIESTIISLLHEVPHILRPGMLLPEDVATACGLEVVLSYLPDHSSPVVKAPGTLPSHYSPDTPVVLLAQEDLQSTLEELTLAGLSISLLVFQQNAAFADCGCVAESLVVEPFSEPYARLLYARLKSLDQPGRSYIIVEKPPLGQAWDGVNDRLRRAAHGNHLPALRGPDLEKQP